MRHVFVETNWVVAYTAPAHLRLPTALALMERAQASELRLYIPAVCLTEAQHPIRTQFHPRGSADSVRKYLAWGTSENKVDTADCAIVRRILDQYETAVLAELQMLEGQLESLRASPGIEVFPLSDAMLTRAVELSTQSVDLTLIRVRLIILAS